MNDSMIFNIITLLPEMFDALHAGVIGRAITNNLIQLNYFNPRDYTHDTHHTVDDRPYGGGPGMVMLYQPLKDTLDDIKRKHTHKAPVIHLSPQGKPATQDDIKRLSTLPELTLLCSRYEGVDERLIQSEVDEEVCIGDFVVSGGELPAMMLIDSITRLLPGTLNDPLSALQDSFADGLLDCPHYTRPETINGMATPKILLSGHHEAINDWRLKEKWIRTWQKRPDLIKRLTLTHEQKSMLDQIKGNDNE